MEDSNNDVGGTRPLLADPPPQTGDGFDRLVFDSGLGADPDAAWSRLSPNESTWIDLAFKAALIGGDAELLWGVWSDAGPKEPGSFDYHDHFTLAEAGSPLSTSSSYPLQALASVDSTCRWGYGFSPLGSEPGVCPVPTTGSISGIVYEGFGAFSTGSERMEDVTVELGEGACPSSGSATTTTASDGSYKFSGLAEGSYCVTVDTSTLPPAPYGWGPATGTVNPRDVSLGPNEAKTGIHFGYYQNLG